MSGVTLAIGVHSAGNVCDTRIRSLVPLCFYNAANGLTCGVVEAPVIIPTRDRHGKVRSSRKEGSLWDLQQLAAGKTWLSFTR